MTVCVSRLTVLQVTPDSQLNQENDISGAGLGLSVTDSLWTGTGWGLAGCPWPKPFLRCMSSVPSWTRGISPMSPWKWLWRLIWSQGLWHPWMCSVKKLLVLNLASGEGLEDQSGKMRLARARTVHGKRKAKQTNICRLCLKGNFHVKWPFLPQAHK